MNKFCQLHLHTQQGSKMDGDGDVYDYIKRASENGNSHMAVTDHGRMSAFFDLQQACNKSDVKPIFGLEQYVIPDNELVVLSEKGKRKRTKSNHLILLAKNEIGYKNLLHLHYISMTAENHFYYNNRSTFSEVFKYKEGLMAGTACIASPFAQLLRNGKEEEAENLFMLFLENFKDNFYVEMQMNELFGEGLEGFDGLVDGQKTVNAFLGNLADKNGVPKVLTGDVHYLNKGDDIYQNVSIAIRDRRTINEAGFHMNCRNLYFHKPEDYYEMNKTWDYGFSDDQISEMLNNTEIIANKCNYELPNRDRMIFPTVTNDDENNLENLCLKTLDERIDKGIIDKDRKEEYLKRIDKELGLLQRKGFSSYVMVLSDIFDFTDKNGMMTGYARGSGGGSLVLYLSNVTKIDPLKYDLIFERFLSENRAPDVVVSYFKKFD